MKRKILAGIASLAMAASMLTAPIQTAAPVTVSAAGDYNYAEALQKSMFFYEVQQAGTLPEWNNVPWRADSMVKEDGTPSDYVDGGWFDAGDHYKFTLTNAYAASILAWGYIEYQDAVDKAGLGELYRNNIQWGMDYVKNCDLGGGKMVGTIGDSDDHVVWCSAEVYMRKHKLKFGDEERPYDVITDSSALALSAAALAQGYMIFKETQPDVAADYLDHAKSLFASADATRSNKDQGAQKSFYPTTSWVDDCMYAACWLYKATGDEKYLDIIKKDYIPEFPLESQSTDKKFTWGLCWDDTSQAAALLYAQITGEQEWIDHVSHHLDYWSPAGYGGKKVDYTPDGLAWLFQWGSARHATTTAFLAMLASDTIFKDNAALASKYNTWGKGQMDYCFGDNANNFCYVLGMGENGPTAFHHRTASGIHDDHWNDLGQTAKEPSTSGDNWQTEYAHTLYGALVGGPDKDGAYVNDVSQYQYSEVAIDYNAGYTAALCAMIQDYGGTPLADFPPQETPKWAEWEVAAVLNGSGDSYTEVKAWAMNHTAWPARVAKDISYRYYFDISELLDAGLSVDQITVEGKAQQYDEGEQGHATVSGPYKYSDTVYYAEIKFEDGRAIQPTGQSEHRDEVQFRVSIPDAIDGQSTKGAWDASNDWSYDGLTATDSLKDPASLNEHITMYVNGALVWGTEPDGTTPSGQEPTEPKVEPTPTEPVPTEAQPTDPQPTEPLPTAGEELTRPDGVTLWGDVDESGKVNVLDVITLNKHLMVGEELSVQGRYNGDVNKSGAPDKTDSLNILKSVVGLIKLPVVS